MNTHSSHPRPSAKSVVKNSAPLPRAPRGPVTTGWLDSERPALNLQPVGAKFTLERYALATFSLVLNEIRRPVAAILHDRPAPDQIAALLGILPENATFDPDLARRWSVPLVLCTRDWASDQKHRSIMLMPRKGTITLGFL